MFNKIHNLKIMQRMIVFVLLPTIIIFGGIIFTSGLWSFSNAVGTYSVKVDESQINQVNANSLNISTFLERISMIPISLTSSQAVLNVQQQKDNGTILNQVFSRVLNSEPDIVDLYYFSNTRFEAHILARGNISNTFVDMSNTVDQKTYNYYKMSWFSNPVSSKAFAYSSPYYDVGGLNQVMISAVAPVIVNGTVLGVVGTDILISQLIQEVSKITIGIHGYPFLITDAGTILSHPLEQYQFIENYKNPKTIFDWANNINSKALAAIGTKMINGESGKGQFAKNYVYYAPIPISKWSLALVLPSREVPTSMSTILSITLISAIAGIIILSILILLFSRSFTKPIKDLSLLTAKLKENDLTVDMNSVKYSNNDEIGILISSFSQMVQSLKSNLKSINEITTTIFESAQVMASSTEEVNASSEEISSISQQMSRGAQEQTIQINETLKQVTNLKNTFNRKYDDIKNVSNLMENITQQINMLALNASIEAARAGEYGRGFSIVADNIRRLADDAKNSLTSIDTSIKDLNKTLSDSIENVSKLIEKVASVSEETASGSEEASAATEEQAATMEEMTASAQELSQISTSLEQLVRIFKIDL